MSDFIKLTDLLEKPLKKNNLYDNVQAAKKCQNLQVILADLFPNHITEIEVKSCKHDTYTIIAPATLTHKIAFQREMIAQEIGTEIFFKFQNKGIDPE